VQEVQTQAEAAALAVQRNLQNANLDKTTDSMNSLKPQAKD